MKLRLDIEERLSIQNLLDQGCMIKEIAIALKRSNSCIHNEIKRNGGARLYNAKIAQDNSNEIYKLSNKDKNSPIQHLRNRVATLEEQMRNLEIKCGIK